MSLEPGAGLFDPTHTRQMVYVWNKHGNKMKQGNMYIIYTDAKLISHIRHFIYNTYHTKLLSLPLQETFWHQAFAIVQSQLRSFVRVRHLQRHEQCWWLKGSWGAEYRQAIPVQELNLLIKNVQVQNVEDWLILTYIIKNKQPLFFLFHGCATEPYRNHQLALQGVSKHGQSSRSASGCRTLACDCRPWIFPWVWLCLNLIL